MENLRPTREVEAWNNIVLAGDVPSNWAWDFVDDRNMAAYNAKTGKGSWGAEFVGTAVTSPSPYARVDATARAASEKLLVGSNPALKWTEVTCCGYYVLNVGEKSVNVGVIV